ncbi:MAG: hypothetical protein LQ342_005420 [Letrouitia transgressa]|nr:MAG: hypothetical protein LQ342_005420 [Letrouitia transgressa]
MEVLGEVSTDTLIKSVEQHCGAGLLRVDASTGSFQIPDDTKPRVINVEFPPLPVGSQRASKLLDHDAFLSSVLDFLPSQKYTVIYTTSVDSATDRSKAVEPETYEMDTSFSSQAHVELKRDFIAHERRASSENVTLPDGALFERYQYFTPGIFMGLVVAIPLLLLLYVAISGVASLQVSYAAFDKETGPAAQNKQQ